MEKVFYRVSGWDGNTEYFRDEENAKKEFNRRLESVDNYSLVINDTDWTGRVSYILCKYYDKKLETYRLLTLKRLRFTV